GEVMVGRGSSRRQAEQLAAEQALTKLKGSVTQER
ncbi:MAG: hypothetical protein KUG80_06035, partial [Gammaproteobacteria bacterium]|nr:hypothetical protein [Gammaproteobacteria bacterium]